MFPQISTCRLCSDVGHRFRSICLIVRYFINNECNNGLLKSGGYGGICFFVFLFFYLLIQNHADYSCVALLISILFHGFLADQL